MTIQDEATDARKYHNLRYVEFLEFLCRIAILCFDIQEPIEIRVFELLKLLYTTVGIETKQAEMVLSPDIDVHLIPPASLAGLGDDKSSSD